MNPSNLEDRLRRLDLRLDDAGRHIGDERIAELGAGADPSDAEAAHLAGCDDCVELLVALGEGLEALAVDEPALGALMAEPPRPAGRPGRRFTPLMIIALAGAAAAAGWFARRAPEPPPAPAAPARPAPADEARFEGPDEVPILPADQVIGLGAADRVAPPPAPPTVDPPAPPATPADVAANEGAAIAPPAPPSRPARRPEAPPPRTLQPPAGLGTLARPDGPRPLERRPVDGPPRGFGQLQLNTRPPARVFIDGKPRGWTPIIDLRLPEGPHDVRLVFDSPLAAEPEQRFRVLIEPDRIWRMTRDNVKQVP